MSERSLNSGKRKQALQRAAVNVLQRFQVGDGNVLVDLVNAGVDGTEFYDLGADAGDKAPVGGAAGGGQLGLDPGGGLNGRCQRITQCAPRGEEGFAAQGP